LPQICAFQVPRGLQHCFKLESGRFVTRDSRILQFSGTGPAAIRSYHTVDPAGIDDIDGEFQPGAQSRQFTAPCSGFRVARTLASDKGADFKQL
jgi:hypothetical protein